MSHEGGMTMSKRSKGGFRETKIHLLFLRWRFHPRCISQQIAFAAIEEITCENQTHQTDGHSCHHSAF